MSTLFFRKPSVKSESSINICRSKKIHNEDLQFFYIMVDSVKSVNANNKYIKYAQKLLIYPTHSPYPLHFGYSSPTPKNAVPLSRCIRLFFGGMVVCQKETSLSFAGPIERRMERGGRCRGGVLFWLNFSPNSLLAHKWLCM